MTRNLRALTIVFNAGLLAATMACSKKTDEASVSTGGGTTASAPSGEQAARHKMALVRFVNASPGRNLDLWFGDSKMFSDVAYKAATAYREVPGERHEFVVEPVGTQPAKNSDAKDSEGLTDGAHYTVVAMVGKDGKQTLNVINDNLAEPASGRSKVRVINAAAEEVDVLSPVDRKEGSADRMRTPPVTDRANNRDRTTDANWDKWFGGVNADSSTSYKEVEPVNTTLDVRPSGDLTHNKSVAGPAVKVPIDFAAGKMYTLVVTGGSRGKALEVIKISDELMGAAATAGKRS